jgi:hypothetical protein
MLVIQREWQHHGLKCLVAIEKAFTNDWYSGYVAVPRSHPYWGKEHGQVKIDVDQVTFAKQGSDDSPWKDNNLWWFGFYRCARRSDTTDRRMWSFERPPPVPLSDLPRYVWTLDEVCAETEKLANQLASRVHYLTSFVNKLL